MISPLLSPSFFQSFCAPLMFAFNCGFYTLCQWYFHILSIIYPFQQLCVPHIKYPFSYRVIFFLFSCFFILLYLLFFFSHFVLHLFHHNFFMLWLCSLFLYHYSSFCLLHVYWLHSFPTSSTQFPPIPALTSESLRRSSHSRAKCSNLNDHSSIWIIRMTWYLWPVMLNLRNSNWWSGGVFQWCISQIMQRNALYDCPDL